MKKKLSILIICLLFFSVQASAQFRTPPHFIKFVREILLKELASAPSAKPHYGTLYVLSSDGELYYQDDEGNAIAISAAVPAGSIDYTGTPVDDDYAKFTDVNTVEGRSYAEMKEDLDLEIGTDIPALSHTMASHSDEDTYDISTTGDIHHGGFISTTYYNCGNSGASITIDWNNGNIQYVTLTAVGVDVTFTEPPNPGKCELWIIQDGTGNRTIDWEHEISPKWPGDVEPTLSTAAGAIDVVAFTFIGGTTYRGLFNGDFR